MPSTNRAQLVDLDQRVTTTPRLPIPMRIGLLFYVIAEKWLKLWCDVKVGFCVKTAAVDMVSRNHVSFELYASSGDWLLILLRNSECIHVFIVFYFSSVAVLGMG